jgi:hypothetical protein
MAPAVRPKAPMAKNSRAAAITGPVLRFPRP